MWNNDNNNNEMKVKNDIIMKYENIIMKIIIIMKIMKMI